MNSSFALVATPKNLKDTNSQRSDKKRKKINKSKDDMKRELKFYASFNISTADTPQLNSLKKTFNFLEYLSFNILLQKQVGKAEADVVRLEKEICWRSCLICPELKL